MCRCGDQVVGGPTFFLPMVVRVVSSFYFLYGTFCLCLCETGEDGPWVRAGTA